MLSVNILSIKIKYIICEERGLREYFNMYQGDVTGMGCLRSLRWNAHPIVLRLVATERPKIHSYTEYRNK